MVQYRHDRQYYNTDMNDMTDKNDMNDNTDMTS